MNECSRIETLLAAHLAGELSASGAQELFAHCASCETCRELVLLHRELQALGEAAEADEPSEERFAELSARVLTTAGSSSSRRRFVRFGTSWKLAVGIAASLLLVVAGWSVGRGRAGSVAAMSPTSPPLVAAMGAEAASNRDLADVENSRFTYSNVSLRSAGEGRVTLDFDVTTHVRTVQPLGSELAREAIVQALLDRSSTGARLRALSYAGASVEPKVREALLLSLRSDPSLAVRLKALEILSDQLEQPAVEAAVLAVLRDDESVQMRLLALDSLAEHRVDHQRIRDVIQESNHPGDEALLVRLAELPGRL